MEVNFSIKNEKKLNIEINGKIFEYDLDTKSIDASEYIEELSSHSEKMKIIMSEEDRAILPSASTEFINMCTFFKKITIAYNDAFDEVYMESDELITK